MHDSPATEVSRPVTLAAIEAARARIAGTALPTPTLAAPALSDRLGVEVHLKLENLQLTGSFKIRGAYNKCSQLDEAQRRRGVVCASAGNHGQGVAYSAQRLGIEATVFMPRGAPYTKVRAIRSYGAKAVLHGESYDEAYAEARRYCAERDAVFVHPYDDPDIMAGQGTVGLEILEALPELGTVVVPVGGGGLIAGVATAIAALRPEVHVVGVVAAASPNAMYSFERGAPVERVQPAETIADGIRVKRPGALTFPVILETVDEIVAVSEEEIGTAIFELLELQHVVAEGAGAAAVAALLSGRHAWRGPVCAVVSGGNIDPNLLVHVIERGLTDTGAYLSLTTTVPDRPGSLTKLLHVLADMELNVLEVAHRRAGVRHPLGHVVIEVTVEAREPGLGDTVIERLREHGYEARLQP